MKKNALVIFGYILLVILSIFYYELVLDIVFSLAYLILPESYEIDVYMIDSLAITMLTIVYAVILFVCIKKGVLKDAETYLHYKTKKYNSFFMILGSSIIILGIGAVSIHWIDFADRHLSFIPLFEESIQSFDETWSDIEESPYIFVFLSVAFVGPIVEEVLFRGIVLESLRKFMSPGLAILFSSLIFGIWHMEPVQVVYTSVAGLAFGIVYYRTRKLRYPILMHIINNFTSALPPRWDTESVNEVIYITSLICILPAVVFLVLMARKNPPLPKRLKSVTSQELY